MYLILLIVKKKKIINMLYMKQGWSKKMLFAFKELQKIELFFREIIEMHGFPKDRSVPNDFSSLARIIIGQQISRSAADSIYLKLVSKKLIDVKSLLKVDLLDLKKIGLSLQKCNYIKNLALKISKEEIILERFEKLSSQEVFKTLINLKGIGEWTINNYRLFALQDIDAWPGSDLALKESIKRLKNFDIRPNTIDMQIISNKWKPFRGAAALILWHYYGNIKRLRNDN